MNRVLAGVLVAVVVLAGGALADELFAPEAATRADEAGAGAGAERLASGEFVGKANHDVSGTVSLVREDDATYLLFEDYEQTQGPDVFVYPTSGPDPETAADLDGAVKALVDGAESTKEGTFRQRLSDDVPYSQFRGVSIWCDRFGVPFGSATLS